jgi:lipid A 3-O-deacylase
MRLSAIGALAVLAGNAADAATLPQDRPVLSIGFENDQFGTTATDRYYTHGTRVALRHGSAVRPFWRPALAWVPLLPKDARVSHESGLIQLISTPGTIRGREVRPGDRPYAGLLAGTMVITGTAPDGRRSDQISLTVGVIGPASLAAEAQTIVHRVQDAVEPRGWRFQLGTEPAINLAWRRSWRFAAPGAAITPHVGAAVGNVYDYAAAGVTLQLGAGLADQSVAALEPFVAGVGALPAGRRPVINLLAGVEGRAVARNLFLDGNTFTAGRGVDKNLLVGDAIAGVSLRWRGVRLSARHVWRSKEFALQRGIQRFGGVTLDVRL